MSTRCRCDRTNQAAMRILTALPLGWYLGCAIEDLCELAKGDCGLDEYEVRTWVVWYRHVTLGLFALAVVAVIRSRAVRPVGRKRGGG